MSETSFADPNASKKPALAEFYVEAVRQEFRSKQEGRPIFEDREFVRIIIPGDRRSMAVEPVNDEHKARWAAQYEAFKEGREMPLEGTPLSQWTPISRSAVEEFAYFHIRTVEDLAAVNDLQLQQLGMGSRDLRQKAKLFLEVAKNGTGPLFKMQAENDAMRGEAVRQADQIRELSAQVALLMQKDQANAGT
jgi:hypothetical protein